MTTAAPARSRRSFSPSPPVWVPRGAGALVISAALHALAAATAAVYLASPARGPADRPAVMPVDLRAADTTFDVIYGAVAAPASSAAARPMSSDKLSLTAKRVVVAHRAAPVTVASDQAVAPAVTVAMEETPARFALSGGTVAAHVPTRAVTTGLTGLPGAESDSQAGSDAVALSEREVSVPARLLSSTPPPYPAEARRAEIEADLALEIEVGVDGRVRASRALSRAGYGLDAAASRALAGYRFSPALRDGRPVPVRMRWTVQFRLQ